MALRIPVIPNNCGELECYTVLGGDMAFLHVSLTAVPNLLLSLNLIL